MRVTPSGATVISPAPKAFGAGGTQAEGEGVN
jgi:hypothetical protein